MENEDRTVQYMRDRETGRREGLDHAGMLCLDKDRWKRFFHDHSLRGAPGGSEVSETVDRYIDRHSINVGLQSLICFKMEKNSFLYDNASPYESNHNKICCLKADMDPHTTVLSNIYKTRANYVHLNAI